MSGSEHYPLTNAEIIERMEKWADVLNIPSGPFVNDDLRLAATRIRELEAALEEPNAVVAEAIAERDAIEAATIERCAAMADWFHNVDEYNYADIAFRIRALKPSSSAKDAAPDSAR
jgi:hypothetical protein